MDESKTVDSLELLGGGVLFQPEIDVYGEIPYESALAMVRERVANGLQSSVEDISESDLKGMIMRDIENYQVTCDLTHDLQELVHHIYHDMAGLSFISRDGLFDRDGFEEININRWDDVEINVHGHRQKTDYQFLNPQQAMDIMHRIFRNTKTKFDDVSPHATADVGNGIRITALRPPLIDAECGISASIRKVNSSVIGREALISYGSLTEPMLRLMELCLAHGVSVCVSGETGAGKTTLASALLYGAADSLRIYTIEEGAREWDFVKRDPETGKVLNSITHTKTRLDDEKPHLNIDQEALCKLSLRFDPDIVAPSEIRGREAFEAMSVANTGHTVCTTIHSNGTADTPDRIVELAKRAYDMADSTLNKMCARAFPILVHMEKGADSKRRITEIREITGYENGEIKGHLLFDFFIEDNIVSDDGTLRVEGNFRQCNPISEGLAQKLLKKGATRAQMAEYQNVKRLSSFVDEIGEEESHG